MKGVSNKSIEKWLIVAATNFSKLYIFMQGPKVMRKLVLLLVLFMAMLTSAQCQHTAED